MIKGFVGDFKAVDIHRMRRFQTKGKAMTESKLNQNYADNEGISALYDGEEFPEGQISLSEEETGHLNNWSLIGAALRDDLPEQINPDFSANVAKAIAAEDAPVEITDQTETKPVGITHTIKSHFKKFGFIFTEIAVAASIACFTVVGFQAFNAENGVGLDTPASYALGPVNGVSLASFQNGSHDNVIQFGRDTKAQAAASNRNYQNRDSRELRELQDLEAERINGYLRGYVLNSSEDGIR